MVVKVIVVLGVLAVIVWTFWYVFFSEPRSEQCNRRNRTKAK